MRWPWVSRRAYDAVADKLAAVVDGLEAAHALHVMHSDERTALEARIERQAGALLAERNTVAELRGQLMAKKHLEGHG